MPQEMLVQYGALGVLTALAVIAVRVLFERTSAAYERERTRADRLEEELRRLNETVRNDYINAISRASQAALDATRAVAEATARRKT